MDEDLDRTGETPPEKTPGGVGGPVPAESADPPGQPPRSWRTWQLVAFVGAGLAVGAAVSAVATLSATHRTAVLENFAAYLNGCRDTLEGVRQGLIDPYAVLDGIEA